ncbi:MarC family NAAT transporter [Serratia marcescens]|nr:MarC family NAAT transporter [Serratia marcescens]ELQ9442365.1 MarC family NAAT transporter [Serratia marcescens]ELT5563125.1 MarC family NAAT transporter [Serratia marcescens]
MMGFMQLTQLVGLGLVLLLPLTNPLTSIAMFLGLSGRMTIVEQKTQSFMASIYVFLIMLVSYYGGQMVMHTFGISIPGLRIAGGLIVALIGFRMLFPQQSEQEAPEVVHKSKELRKDNTTNIAFVPLAMPGTAGPGTIAMIISSASTMKNNPLGFQNWVLFVGPIVTFLLIAIILWLCLRSSAFIMRVVGRSGIEAISRLMGFLLICMGTQFIINGILAIAAGALGASV